MKEEIESGSLIGRAGRIASVMARHGLKDLIGGIGADDAQEHRATLENGDHVAVKVQRPGARAQIEQDLELLTLFAEKTAGRASVNRLVDIPALTRHLSEGLRIELDFTNEAASMERMRDI